MRVLMMVAATAAMVAATAAPAQAQMFVPRASAYAHGAYADGCGGRFTLAGARAGITVLGVDLDGSAGVTVGLHDRCRSGGGQEVIYAPAPPPQPVYMQGGYDYGYGRPAYEAPSYAYGGGYPGGGYGYGYPAPSYGPPCGC